MVLPILPVMQPLVSVIIPSGRAEMVPQTIRALEKQDIGPDALEIIVVTTAQNLGLSFGSGQVKIVHVEQLFSPGKMRNIGASVAAGDFWAFIDDDCIPPPVCLSVLLASFSDETELLAAVGCRVIGIDQGFWTSCADYSLFAAYQHKTKGIRDLGSAAIMVRPQAFLEVGGFDEGLLASEDWDLSLRLVAKGWKCLFQPKAKVMHNHECNSFNTIMVKSYLYGVRSNLTVQRRHKEQMSWLARLSLRMASPWLYWLLIFPYSGMVSLHQGVGFIRYDKKLITYLPIIFIARCVYHYGVWRSLWKGRHSSGDDT